MLTVRVGLNKRWSVIIHSQAWSGPHAAEGETVDGAFHQALSNSIDYKVWRIAAEAKKLWKQRTDNSTEALVQCILEVLEKNG